MSAADELILYAMNEAALYPQRLRVQDSLIRQLKSGKYDHRKGPKSWQNWFDIAAIRHAKEFPDAPKFSRADRRDAAMQQADWFVQSDGANLRVVEKPVLTRGRAASHIEYKKRGMNPWTAGLVGAPAMVASCESLGGCRKKMQAKLKAAHKLAAAEEKKAAQRKKAEARKSELAKKASEKKAKEFGARYAEVQKKIKAEHVKARKAREKEEKKAKKASDKKAKDFKARYAEVQKKIKAKAKRKKR